MVSKVLADKLEKVRKGLDGKLKTNAKAGVGGGKSIDYLDLPGVLDTLPPVLSEYGLLMRLGLSFDSQSGYNVASVTVQDTDTGEEYSTSMAFSPDVSPRDAGSTITYYHRYLSLSLVSQRADKDNDAENVPKPAATGGRRTLPTRR